MRCGASYRGSCCCAVYRVVVATEEGLLFASALCRTGLPLNGVAKLAKEGVLFPCCYTRPFGFLSAMPCASFFSTCYSLFVAV